MRRGYCVGGPIHGQVMNVKHGSSMVHAPTGARYGWIGGQWVHMPSNAETNATVPSMQGVGRLPVYRVIKTGGGGTCD